MPRWSGSPGRRREEIPTPSICWASCTLLVTEVPHDEETSRIHWLTQSAEQGNQYAQYLLNHLEENRPPSAMLAVTRLLHHMSRIFRDNSVPKSRPGGIQIDRKRLKKLQEKRMALGHKLDDHEEQWPDHDHVSGAKTGPQNKE